jgi:hypothetical protein
MKSISNECIVFQDPLFRSQEKPWGQAYISRYQGISGLVLRMHSFLTRLAFYRDILAFYLALCSLFGE